MRTGIPLHALFLAFLLSLMVVPSLRAQTISANFSGTPTTGCAPLTVNFSDLTTAPVTTWEWDIDNNGTVEYTTRNATHVYNTPGTYTVRLRVTDQPGPNTGTLVITNYITVLAPPTVDAGINRFLCVGTPVTIGGSPTATGGRAPYTYLWAPAAGLSSATVANPVANPGANTTYTVTVTDANGCVATDMVTVTPVNPPVANAGAAPPAACRGNSQPIGGAPTGSGGTPPYTYTWSPAAGLSSATVANPLATPNSTTTYTVTVRDANNCTASSPVTVTVNQPPTVSAGPNRAVCGPGGVLIGGSPTASGGSGPYTYSWSPAAGLSSTTIANPIANPAASTVYKVVVTGVNGCSDSATTNVTIPGGPPPVASAGVDATICNGFSVPVGGAPSASGGTAPYTYSWSPAAGLSSATVANPLATPGITTNYILSVTDGTGCIAYDTVRIVVRPRPTILTGGNRTVCLGSSVTIGGVPTASGSTSPYTYVWSPAAGLSSTSVPNPLASPTTTTTYKVVVTDANGCRDSGTTTVTVTPLPIADAGTNVNSCAGSSVTIGGAPTATGGTGPYNYQWLPIAGLDDATAANPVANPGVTTTYTVVISDANGCVSLSDSVRVSVFPIPVPTVTPLGPTTFCDGDSLRLTVSAAFNRYVWSNGDTTRTITVKTGGSYTVTVTDVNGCLGTSTATNVTVNPLPVPVIAANGPTTFCQGDSVQLRTVIPYSSYRWSNGATTPTIIVRASGSYTVIATDGNGCADTSAPVVVRRNLNPAKPIITSTGPTTFCQGDSVLLTAPASPAIASYLWSNGATTRTVKIDSAGRYTVQVTDTAGCRNISDTTRVTVNPLPAPRVIVTGPTTFCQGDSVQLSVPAGYLNYLWSNGARTRTIMAKQQADYHVRVTGINGCAGSSDTVAVTVHPVPALLVSYVGSTKLCQGDSIQLSAPTGYVSYRWSNGDTTISIMAKQTGNYHVRVTDLNGCFGRSDTVPVTVNKTPAPKLSTNGPTTFCGGDSVRLSAPLGFASYLWSDGGTTRFNVVKATGSFSVRVTDSNGCAGRSDTIRVTVNGVPTPRLSASGPANFCQGDSVRLTAPVGYVSYLWSNGKTGNSILVKTTGNYFVRVVDTGGCRLISDTIAVKANSNPKPKITANGPTRFCQGDSVALSAPNGFASYRWSNGDSTQTIVAKNGGIYSVTVVDSNGCRGTSAPLGLQVNALPPRPRLTISGDTAFCQGDSVRLIAPLGYSNYLWSNGKTGIMIVAKNSGDYFVTVTNAQGCKNNSDTVNVTAHPLPTKPDIIAGGPTTFCEGDSVELAAPFGYASYLWSSGDTTQTIFAKTSGNYRVSILDDNGCSSMSDSLPVKVNAVPDLKITANGPTTLCEGDTVVLELPKGFTSYFWSTGESTRMITVNASGSYDAWVTNSNGCSAYSDTVVVAVNTPPVPQIVTVNGPTLFCDGDSTSISVPTGFVAYLWSNGDTTSTINVKVEGNYTVQVTDSNGCKSVSDTAVIRVNPAPLPKITANGSTSLCKGDSVILDAPLGYSSYIWSTGDTASSIMVSQAGSYSVAVTDVYGCYGASEPVEVKVNELPTAKIEVGGSTAICHGDSLALSAPVGFAGYLWSTGATTRVLNVSDSGSYHVMVTDSNGCRATSDTVATTMRPLPARPTLTVNGLKEFCEGDSTILEASPGFLDYRWSNGDSGRVITVGASGVYTVMGLDTIGCYGLSDSISIDVRPMPHPLLTAGGPTTSCLGDSVTIMAPAGYVSYLWANGDTTNTITVKASGDYAVAVVDTNGCSGISDTLTVNLVPTIVDAKIAIFGPTEMCSGDSVQLSAPAGYDGYLWSTGDTVRYITVSQSGRYSVNLIDSAGCQGLSDTVNVIVHPAVSKPDIAVNGPTKLCKGDSVTLEAPSGHAGYLWSNGEITPSITLVDSGSYSVRVSDMNGCFAISEPVHITLHHKPYVVVDGPSMVCQDSVSVYEIFSDSLVNYNWQVLGVDAILSGQGTNRIELRWRDTGSATVTVYATDTISGCFSTRSIDVSVTAPIIPVITGADKICVGDSTMLDAGDGYLGYRWSTGDTTQRIFVSESGIYTVTVLSAGGCGGSSSYAVDKIRNAPKPTITITTDQRIATDTAQLAVIGGDFTDYVWYFNDNWMPQEKGRFVVARENGIYRVETTDSNGCRGNSEIQVSLLKRRITGVSLPNIKAAPGDTIVIPITLDYVRNMAPNEVVPYTATIRVNKTMLMPVDTTPRGMVDGDDRLIILKGHHVFDGSTTIKELRFLTMLGNAEAASLKLEEFTWGDSSIAVEVNNGMYSADSICRQGGTRLFNATGRLSLEQNRPNPAMGITNIDYETREQGRVKMIIVDLSGQTVAELVDGELSPGRYSVKFDASNLTSGIYLIRLETESGQVSRVMHVRN